MKKPFVVAIARDPSLIASLTESYKKPDLIFTTNSVHHTNQGYTDVQIAFSDFFEQPVFIPHLDSDLWNLLLNQKPVQEPNGLNKVTLKEARQRFQETFTKNVLKSNTNIIVNTYFNTNSNLLRCSGLEVTGPNDKLAIYHSRKSSAYLLALQCEVPIPPRGITQNLEEVTQFLDQQGDLFVSNDNPFCTVNLRAQTQEDLEALDINSTYLVTFWLPKQCSPNSQVLIGKNGLFYLGLTDQIIEEDVKYAGNLFPSQASEENQSKIRDYSLRLSKKLQRQGYKGIVGFDWIVNNDVLLAEINPRKNRSTPTLVACMDTYRPDGSPSITELEIQASLGVRWDNVQEWSIPENVNWGMKLYRPHKPTKITHDILPTYSDNTIFANQSNETKVSILNFPKTDTPLPNPSEVYDIARIIVTGKDRTQVQYAIAQAEKEITDSLA